ncbi:hypothetical protein CYLTODRAFT_398459 [Cylindrobasidium torrendii FP15055 ss-10]|uniref:N-acetyltransferase domain-containing protein n=1 Tax=Cylindrobasidium torrendii FP15055 ss-10 TaxID=1314674 RepID=A0A0D7B7V8_9AGAR|nr:hypothetical protein CYLTODRAFT_398459 [Cylindrobasidium torrendii FP15055 ss-10]
MPSIAPANRHFVHRSAATLPDEFWSAARRDPAHFNIILPIALDYRKSGDRLPGETPTWILFYNSSGLEFVSSLTSTKMGTTYPLFIASATLDPLSCYAPSQLTARVEHIAQVLLSVVPNAVKRIYSIFAPAAISHAFCPVWSRLTNVRTCTEPYYAAKLSVCTLSTLSKRSPTLNPGVELRFAAPADLDQVARLCYSFAAESAPFTLTHDQARREAAILIEKHQVWVHTVEKQVASIAAYTRNADGLATITKVYTSGNFRRKGCAERLQTNQGPSSLFGHGFNQIALFVGVANPARFVYGKVGFQGLDDRATSGFEYWTEIGFDRSVVELGHW